MLNITNRQSGSPRVIAVGMKSTCGSWACAGVSDAALGCEATVVGVKVGADAAGVVEWVVA